MAEREWMPDGTALPDSTVPLPAASQSDSWQAPGPQGAPAGWYADQHRVGTQRYWDGSTWTEHQRPASAAAGGYPPEPPQRKRLSRGAIAGIVVGVSVVVIIVLVSLVAGAFSVFTDIRSGESLDAPVPEEWSTIPVMEGRGFISLDPTWSDVSDYAGADLLEQSGNEASGLDFVVDGIWEVDDPSHDTGVWLTVWSAADVGGPSTARLEAWASVNNSNEGIDDVEVTSERAFTTATGHRGYLIEYTYPYYSDQISVAVGVIVDGRSHLVVFAEGDDTVGDGVDVLETVLNSFVSD